MKRKNTISIIIPTIGRNSIRQAVDSAISTDSEIVSDIIIADNSQNNEELLQSLQSINEARVKIVSYPQRLGMADSWNKALIHAESDWIIYLHDDDLLYPDALSGIVNDLEKDVGFVFCNFVVTGRLKRKPWRYKNVNAFASINTNCPKFVSTIINKKALLSVGGWNNEYGYFLDYVTFLKIASTWMIKHNCVFLGEYRLHEFNLSNKSLRNVYYGNNLGCALKDLFALYETEEERFQIINHMIPFVYPKIKSVCKRLHDKILSIIDVFRNTYIKY